MSVDTDEIAANARLIASAPALLEALRRVDFTLSVHGHIDAETPLHQFVIDAIRVAVSDDPSTMELFR